MNKPFSHYVSLDTLNHLIIDATIEKCGSFANDRILSAIKQRWIHVLRQRMEAINNGTYVAHLDSSAIDFREVDEDLPTVTEPTHEEVKAEFEDEGDDFDDAEVETAQTHCLNDYGSMPVRSEAQERTAESPRAAATESEGPAPGNAEDFEDDISISDVSDLDDKEPETRDLVIGMLDKLTRPSSKKSGAPMWKVKMKYGVLQVR